MIDRGNNKISVSRQCEFLGLNRSSLYYEPVAVSEDEQRLMNRVDEIYTTWPFYGARRIAVCLIAEGFEVGRYHVGSIMQAMGLQAIYPRRNLSKRNSSHKVYPYLLKGLDITRANQVWSTDVTYIRLARGFIYLVAIIDWYSRHVLSWRLSNTLETSFCVEALKEANDKYGAPDIFNTDQGAQFTSEEFTKELLNNGCQISMDGRGRALDNIFVERLWRSLKYEDIYIKEYRNVPEVKIGIGNYFVFYNTKRPHQSLGYRTPEHVYWESRKGELAECA